MNSAQRLYELLAEASQAGDSDKTRDVWAKAFHLPEEYQGPKLNAEVSMKLSALHQELEALRASMNDTFVPEEVFEPPLRKVESAISPTNIGAQWRSFSKHITPEVLLSLRYNSAILGVQERPIDEDELDSLIEEVRELEQKLKEADLSPAVKALIERHVESIMFALSDYRIKGASAIKEAVHKAAGDLIEHKEDIATSRDSEAVTRLGQLWFRVTQIGDSVVKADRAIESGKRMWALIEPVFKSGSGAG